MNSLSFLKLAKFEKLFSITITHKQCLELNRAVYYFDYPETVIPFILGQSNNSKMAEVEKILNS